VNTKKRALFFCKHANEKKLIRGYTLLWNIKEVDVKSATAEVDTSQDLA
jgi:hypothetical protein